jgi:hypothetical protein
MRLRSCHNRKCRNNSQPVVFAPVRIAVLAAPSTQGSTSSRCERRAVMHP